MVQVDAAVVESFGMPPRARAFEIPEPGEAEELIDVLAVGLHPRVRSGASGAHYTSSGRLPLIPGVDGIGRRADGTLVYFVSDDDQYGTMATRAAVDPRRMIVLPEGLDVDRIAAAMNPAMSSWVALRRRITLAPGSAVLVLGATGNAGAMAVRIARLLGAGTVIAAGRNRGRLDTLDADVTVALDEGPAALGTAASGVDVVLDYLWGTPTQEAIPAILTARDDRSRPLDWIEIGSMAGADITLPSAALRSAHLRLIGSGQGSIGAREYLAELPALVDAIADGRIEARTRAVALADVERAWGEPEEPGVRTVVRMG